MSAQGHRHRFSQVMNDSVGRPNKTESGCCAAKIDGTAYLLLETCGAANRAMPAKSAVTIQVASAYLPIQRRYAATRREVVGSALMSMSISATS